MNARRQLSILTGIMVAFFMATGLASLPFSENFWLAACVFYAASLVVEALEKGPTT